MLKGGGLIGGLVALAMVLPFLHSAEGQSRRPITLEGTVRSESNQPLAAVHVAIPKLSFDRMLDLSAEGAFKVTLPATSKTHFRCRISAPGFESRSLTAVVRSGASSLGIVRLKPFVELGSVLVAPSAEGMVTVDFWLTSKTTRPLIFDHVAIAANDLTQKESQCPSFESTPQATLRFGGTAVVTHSDGATGPALHVRTLEQPLGDEPAREVAGVVFFNPCGEKLVKLVAPFSFSLTEKDMNTPRKLRIEVPASLAIAEGTSVHPDWRRAIVSLSLRNGGVISAAAQ